MSREKITIRRRACDCHGVHRWVVTDPSNGQQFQAHSFELAIYAAQIRAVQNADGIAGVVRFLQATTDRRMIALIAEVAANESTTDQLITAEVDRAVDHFENAGSEPPC